MRKLLNTLYIVSPDSYISKDGESLVISKNNEKQFQIPILNLEQIVTMGYMGISPGAMKLCCEKGVSISFLSPNARFISHVHGKSRGNVLLRKQQYLNNENERFVLELSKIIVAGKIYNYKQIMSRFQRDNYNDERINSFIKRFGYEINKISGVEDINTLRGVEGRCANEYFSIFNVLITNQKADFVFNGRSRRPPKDNVNALLSFVYLLITNDCIAALESVGLDPYVGFLHTIRPGRASLALDLVEEFRAYLGDRLAITLINRKQITKKDFDYFSDSVMLNDNGRKKVISAWQDRKKDNIMHPFLKEKIPVGLLPYSQAMLLARYIRNDIDNYPVFLIK